MAKQKRLRIAKAERSVIERGLDRNESARKIANGLERSASSISIEIKASRTIDIESTPTPLSTKTGRI